MDVLHLMGAIIAIALSLYYYLTRTFNYWKARNVRGPKPEPLFGNIKEWTAGRRNMALLLKDVYNKYPNEKVVGIYRMTTPCLLLRDLDVMKHILIKDFDLFDERGVEFSKEGLGQNIFHADAETWRILRSKFSPMFTSGKLKNMLHLMTELGDRFVDYIQRHSEHDSEHEVRTLMQKYTSASIAACAFGQDINMIEGKTEVLDRLNKLVLYPNYATYLDMMYPGILTKIKCSLIPAEARDFFANLVQTIIAQRKGLPIGRKDFMDLILELRNQKVVTRSKIMEEDNQVSLELTDSLIAAQAFVFFVAGYETSATTMSFMLYELAKNRHIQDKLIEEIDEVLKRHNGEVTYDTLTEMKYMQKVFDETLRLYPIIDPIQRVAKKDYHIPGTNVHIEKGQLLLIPPFSVHHDAQYYPEPEKFDPERFAPEVANNRHACAYLPFGVGPRNCIGMRFAKMQSQVCITKLFSKFCVTTSKNTETKVTICPKMGLVGPSNGIYLNIIPREK